MSGSDDPNNPARGAYKPRSAAAALTPVAQASTEARGVRLAGASFVPGSVFAGRYRVITLLGRGGMGEVWRADDLVLQEPVALKLLRSGSAEGRARVLNEVRLARQITHPAVCRVFDVGEAEGYVFYSMELVRGEDLAALLKRVGRLPSEKVLDIARQLCGGLAAAHAQGVLHRDLKPANVLVDQDGGVRITDFGIAMLRGESTDSEVVGTPAYMAPEQLSAGTPLSERTDVYALGLILYELLVGRRPFPGQPSVSARPPVPSDVVPDADPRLERVIMRALAPDPRDRPPGAAAITADLVGPAPVLRPKRVWPWIVGVGLVAALSVLTPWLLPPAGQPQIDHDTLMLADFTNSTGEPVFDGALKVALAVALEQSPFLKVFPDERVRDTLRLMQRAPDERVTPSVAREIARREQLKAYVAGSIERLGTHYVLALEALDAETGDVIARDQKEIADKEQVLTALGAATSRLRERLGESLASIRRFDVPLPRATTSSLDALHAYALALDQGRINLRVESIPHLERAIALDPSFAMAQAQLSGVYANTGRSVDAPALARRAFDLRQRVSERERFFISWRYYVDAAQDWDKALELAQSWTKTYPREAFAFNSLGMALGAFGRHAEAVERFREALRLDAAFIPPYGNLAGSLIALNRFAEVGRLLDTDARGIEADSLRRAAYVLAFLDNDSAAMAAQLDLERNITSEASAFMWRARTSVFSGQLLAAHDLFQRGAEAVLRGGSRELAAQWTMEDAESHAIAGQYRQASQEVSAGLALARDNFTLERASRTLALCAGGAAVEALASELAARFPTATLTTRIHLPVVAAALAVRRGEPSRALALLDPVKPHDGAPSSEFWPAYLRGQAYLGLKDGRAAGAQFQSIVDHRGAAPTSALYPLAHLGLARASALNGEIAAARLSYEAFFTLWKDADTEIHPLSEARAEYARLQ